MTEKIENQKPIEKILITLTDLETLILSDFPNDKAEVFVNALKDIMMIKDEYIYICNSNLVFEQHRYNEGSILTNITKIIQNSFKNLSVLDQTKLTKMKNYQMIFENANVKKYLPQLINGMCSNSENIKFNFYFNELHFLNGYLDLYDLQFKKRILKKHYITKCIDRDFEDVKQIDIDEVLKYLKVIYDNDEDLKTVLMTLGSALSGKSTVEQDLMIFIGKGSGGKSFTLELTRLGISDVYFKDLKDDTFSVNNGKTDKIFNSFLDNPQYRITWINEPKERKADGSLLKTFCDGKVQTTKLYEDGCFTVDHYSKPVFTMNTLMDIKIDSGIARRMKGYETNIEFVDYPELVNEKERKFLKDKLLKDKLSKQPHLLNALVFILAQHCNLWLKGEPIKYSQRFVDAKNSIINVNDQIQDFIDFKLVITNNENHRIGKTQMLDLFKEMYNDKKINDIQLRNALKEKSIKYSEDKRVNNIKGCYLGVQPKLDLQNDLDDLRNNQNEENERIQNLLNKIQELENANSQKQKVNLELSVVNINHNTSNIINNKPTQNKKIDSDNDTDDDWNEDDYEEEEVKEKPLDYTTIKFGKLNKSVIIDSEPESETDEEQPKLKPKAKPQPKQKQQMKLTFKEKKDKMKVEEIKAIDKTENEIQEMTKIFF